MTVPVQQIAPPMPVKRTKLPAATPPALNGTPSNSLQLGFNWKPLALAACVVLIGLGIGAGSYWLGRVTADSVPPTPLIADAEETITASQTAPPEAPSPDADSLPPEEVANSDRPEVVPYSSETKEPPTPDDISPEIEVPSRSPEEVVAEAEKSVVEIRVQGKDGRSVGSGFLVASHGIVATNYHVIEGATSVQVILSSGMAFESPGWTALSPGEDIALIVCSHDLLSLPELKLRTTPASKAETVFAIGFPMGLGSSVSSGIVSGIRRGQEFGGRHSSDSTWIQTTTAMAPGNSGGPLLDKNGEVLGICTEGFATASGLNFAVAAGHIERLLENPAPEQSWALLPAPRNKPKVAAGVAPKAVVPNPDLAIKAAAQTIADGVVKAQKAQTAGEQSQRELDRLESRIQAVRKQQTVIDAQGTAMKTRLGEINGEGEGLIIAGEEIDAQISDDLDRAEIYDSELPRARKLERHDVVAHHRRELTRIRINVLSLRKKRATLTARYAALDREAAGLREQYAAKVAQFQELEAEIEQLEMERAALQAE